MRTYLQSAGCTTGAGRGVESFFRSLTEGKSAVRDGVARVGSGDEISWLTEALRESDFTAMSGDRTGIILASTKGELERLVDRPGDWALQSEPLGQLLTHFLESTGLRTVRQAVVSNACASSHGAFFLARNWLRTGRCDRVIVAAVDVLGNFIEKGFRSLQAVCGCVPRPFARDRDGLALGEGAAVVVLTTQLSPYELEEVSLVTEGIALTRPSQEGLGLERCLREVQKQQEADLIIAHATGTIANDSAEARVYGKLSPQIPITGTKWCVGHTLGASGALDVIAAMEVLRRGCYFRMATTPKADPSFSGNFLIGREPAPTAQNPARVLVSSLGFGGMNAALSLSRGTT